MSIKYRKKTNIMGELNQSNRWHAALLDADL